MGMQSPELLTLVESCPKGAETLVTGDSPYKTGLHEDVSHG
jgi:hypothetical protein